MPSGNLSPPLLRRRDRKPRGPSLLFNSIVFVYGFLPLGWPAITSAPVRPPAGNPVADLRLLHLLRLVEPRLRSLLAISILFNYAASRRSARPQSVRRCRLDTQGRVAANLGALVYYKYAVWLVAWWTRPG